MQESNINEIIAADYLYLDSQTGKKILFEQYVKSRYNQHFDNEHNNDLEYINFDGQEAYYKGSDEYSVFIWDNGDYILLASKSNPRTDMAYSKTATHELGHALGYAGHSTTKGDIMYTSSTSNTTNALTTRDINHLKQIY